MDEQRLQAYVNLINQLLNCSRGEEVQIIETNRELVDAYLSHIMAQVAEQLAANCHQNSADFLLSLRSKLFYANPSFQDYLQFLEEVLEATHNSNGDPKVVYPLLQANLDKLDDNFIDILQNWTSAKLSEAQSETAEYIANTIWNFSYLISNFRLGNKANNMEIAIAGYEEALNVFTCEGNRESWAAIQNNLGNVYSNRIRHDRAENLELAIAAYQLALSVRTKQDFPIQWASTQNNLGNAYSKRIRHDRAENLELAIAAYQLALSVRTKQDFPIQWASTQNNLGGAYCDRIRDNKAENQELAIEAYQLALSVYTKQDFPEEWAMTQNNLGNAYREGIRSDRAENLELAIEAYQLALSVYTKQDFPIQWASTQNNLGIAYSNRIRNNRAENLELAIEAYQLALSVRTKQDFPIDWALTQTNLGTAYCDRIRDNRAENQELAIEAYQLALSVYTKPNFPIQWASTQNNLGNAYWERISHDRAENLELAIEAYQLALSVRTKQDFPIDWAITQNNLGNAYKNRIRDNRAENLELAIEAYQLALSVRTKEDFPIRWAMTQNNLGGAYFDRIRDDRYENLELAIEAYQLALSVYTKQDFPIQWASTQNNLGNAYCDRIRNYKAENLELAIEAYQLALSVRTKEDFPIQWALTQNNLGIAYWERMHHDRAENQELAIEAYQLALSVYTKEDSPIDWAMTQNNLGIAYWERIRNNRAENLELAIEAYQLALSVRTKEDLPIQWAGTQNNLGTAYYERIRGDKQENLKNAIAAYQLALEVYTPEGDPINCLTTSRNLGNLHFNQGNWQPAIDVYQTAITAVEISRSEAMNDQRRQEIMAEAIRVYHKLVQAYINIEQNDKAIETVERSKARDLVQLLSNRDLYPKGDVSQQIITELDRLRRNIPSLEKQLQVVFEKLFGNRDEKQQQQRQSLEESRKRLQQELQQSRQQLDQVLKEINDNYDPNFSLTQTVETIPFKDIQSLIDQGTAMIEWYVTRDNILTFIVTSHKQPIVVSSSAEKLKTLEKWDKDYTNAYRNQKNQWITNLSTRLAELATILDIDNIISEIDRVFETEGGKCDRLILVPHRFLHLFPLHALPLSKGNLLLDRFKRGVSYAPSSQLLKLTKQQDRPDFNNLFAIQNPTRPEAKPLPGSKLEVDKIRQYFDPNHSIILAEADATEAKLNQNIKELRSAHCVHFSCHGKFEPKSPLESALLLADADLTLYKIFKLDLNQCRIVGFSACETGMTLSSNKESSNKNEDLSLPSGLDEYIGLPSGFLYAGSPSVVSTLWTVDPLATALLVIKFYKNLKRLPTLEDGDVSTALVNAQFWLRTLNSKTLLRIQESQQFQGLMAEIFENNDDYYWIFDDLLSAAINRKPYPFANPYYWAAFVTTGT